MIELNITATTTEHTVLKDYLENNVGEVLAEKINNGVRIEKDGKTLVNKKDLTTFLSYACEEARKQSEKSVRHACINDTTVFGWAIHYFEEDSIEGTLYNEDGTAYKPQSPTVSRPAVPVAPKPKTPSLFDMMEQPATDAADTDGSEAEDNAVMDEPDEPEACDTPEEFNAPEEESRADDVGEPEADICSDEPIQPAMSEMLRIDETQYVVDKDGVVHEFTEQTCDRNASETLPAALTNLFGDTLIAR